MRFEQHLFASEPHESQNSVAGASVARSWLFWRMLQAHVGRSAPAAGLWPDERDFRPHHYTSYLFSPSELLQPPTSEQLSYRCMTSFDIPERQRS